MRLRHLPGNKEYVIDKSILPDPNLALYNPSADGPYVYIRVTKSSSIVNMNSIAICEKTTKRVKLIDSPMHLLCPCNNLYQGLEDLRIVLHEGILWFTATCTHASNRMTNELVYGRFDKDVTRVEKIWVVDIGVLPVKNVCPFVYNGHIHILDVFMRKLYRMDYVETDDIYVATLVRKIQLSSGIPSDFNYRGSTSPVHLHGNTWGFVVHNHIRNEESTYENSLAYFHNWVEMDIERGYITFLSSPFWCAHWGIEYISGITYDRATNTVLLYEGVCDNTPLCITTTLDRLRNSK